jgi:hypothetical protein
MRVAARSDGPGSRLRPFPGARPPRRGQWTAGAHQLPTEFVTAVKVSNDRMRGSLFSSCKISLLFRFEVLLHSSVKLVSVQSRLLNAKGVCRYLLSDFRNSKPIALVTDRERAHPEIAYVNAVRSRPAVKGTVRSRTPVASKIAFASAAGTGEPAASPAPYAGWSG